MARDVESKSSILKASRPESEADSKVAEKHQADSNQTIHYNLVFFYLDHFHRPHFAYTTVALDMPIEYGSDLDEVRKCLKRTTDIESVVIVRWQRIAGPTRPDGKKPLVSIVV